MENKVDKFKNTGQGNHRQRADFEVMRQCLIIHLNQDLDHHTAIYVRERSDQLIEKGNIKNIIFDFKKSGFMDSSGIGVIMGRYKKVIFTGGKAAVVNVEDSVDRIFKLSGLYKIILKFSSIQEAVESL